MLLKLNGIIVHFSSFNEFFFFCRLRYAFVFYSGREKKYLFVLLLMTFMSPLLKKPKKSYAIDISSQFRTIANYTQGKML